jgi:hypothetical protein
MRNVLNVHLGHSITEKTPRKSDKTDFLGEKSVQKAFKGFYKIFYFFLNYFSHLGHFIYKYLSRRWIPY